MLSLSNSCFCKTEVFLVLYFLTILSESNIEMDDMKFVIMTWSSKQDKFNMIEVFGAFINVPSMSKYQLLDIIFNIYLIFCL